MNASCLLAIICLGCAATSGSTVAGPCGDAALAGIVTECRARKVVECKGIPDSECPLIKECDARIDDWGACGR